MYHPRRAVERPADGTLPPLYSPDIACLVADGDTSTPLYMSCVFVRCELVLSLRCRCSTSFCVLDVRFRETLRLIQHAMQLDRKCQARAFKPVYPVELCVLHMGVCVCMYGMARWDCSCECYQPSHAYFNFASALVSHALVRCLSESLPLLTLGTWMVGVLGDFSPPCVFLLYCSERT
jgi:hypothetical protein